MQTAPVTSGALTNGQQHGLSIRAQHIQGIFPLQYMVCLKNCQRAKMEKWKD